MPNRTTPASRLVRRLEHARDQAVRAGVCSRRLTLLLLALCVAQSGPAHAQAGAVQGASEQTATSEQTAGQNVAPGATPGENAAAAQTPAPSAPEKTPVSSASWTKPNLTWRPGKGVWFRLGGGLQTRYTFNHRNELSGERANTSRFSVPRARIILDGGITEYLSFRVRIGVLWGGTTRFEQAFADAKLTDYLTLRAGILRLPASIGDSPSPLNLQGLDYGQFALQTSGGNAAGLGARATFGRFRAQAYFSNGLRTAFSEFAAPVAARLAVTGRVEGRLLTQDGFDRFYTESSFRGSDLALRVGAAVHYQQGRIDGRLPRGDLEQYTADVTLEGSGFNVIVTGRMLRIRPAEPDSNITHDPGFLAQAGVFVHERIELWGRYDALLSDGKIHAFPDGRNGLRDDYQSINTGINCYLLPRTNVARVQADFSYVFGPIASTWATASDNAGVLWTAADSQWTLRTQLALSY